METETEDVIRIILGELQPGSCLLCPLNVDFKFFLRLEELLASGAHMRSKYKAIPQLKRVLM
jgi:hypothetical protein